MLEKILDGLKKILEDKKKRSDLILVSVCLVVGLSLLFFMFLTRTEGSTVVVTINDKKVAEYSLAIDGIYYLNGGTNVLAIEDGWAYMKEANCPGYQDCVERGRIKYVIQSIVCRPNGITVEIK